jgi:hypothetical protein
MSDVGRAAYKKCSFVGCKAEKLPGNISCSDYGEVLKWLYPDLKHQKRGRAAASRLT